MFEKEEKIQGGLAMFDEEDQDDGLGVPRGLMNGFIFMVLVFMVIGTIWGLAK